MIGTEDKNIVSTAAPWLLPTFGSRIINFSPIKSGANGPNAAASYLHVIHHLAAYLYFLILFRKIIPRGSGDWKTERNFNLISRFYFCPPFLAFRQWSQWARFLCLLLLLMSASASFFVSHSSCFCWLLPNSSSLLPQTLSTSNTFHLCSFSHSQ